MLVGDFPNEEAEERGHAFGGASGWMLDQLLAGAGIARSECYTTNVFSIRPRPSLDIKSFCGAKADAIPAMPDVGRGRYVRAEYSPHLTRLYKEVSDEKPNIVVALGPIAVWAFLYTAGIKAVRGAVATSHPTVARKLGHNQKIIPTYHPAMILRDSSQRPVAIADLGKARRENEFTECIRPSRSIWLYPDIEDLERFEHEHIIPATLLSVDIETKGDQITCIGFSTSPSVCLVIPLFQGDNGNYWALADDEHRALNYIARWLTLRPSVFQHGMYDVKFLWRRYGIPTPLALEDTMLLHHAWQPEMEKGLGFLGTLYTSEPSWKFMRKGKRHD